MTDEAVLFGGWGEQGVVAPLGDTWVYQQGTWTNITADLPVSPAARGGASFSYDPENRSLILTEGAYCFFSSNRTGCESTWSFNGSAWQELPDPGPSACGLSGDGATAAYDSHDGYLIFVPWEISAPYSGCTAAYSNGTWTDLSYNVSTNETSFGPNLWDPAMVDDPSAGGVLMYGGQAPPDVNLPQNTTFLFSNGSWSNLSGTSGPAPPAAIPGTGATYDSLDDLAEVFIGISGNGSSVLNETWGYNGTWWNLTGGANPSPRIYPSLCWDAAENATLLFGGSEDEQVLNSTWELSSTPFIDDLAVRPSPNPVDVGSPASFQATFAGGVAPFQYIWSFGDGGESALPTPSHTYREAENYSASVTISDAAHHVVSLNFTVVVRTAPAISLAVSSNPTDVGWPVRCSVTERGGASGLGYVWSFGDGTTSNLSAPAHTYGSAGLYLVQVWFNDSGGGHAYANLSEAVSPALTIPYLYASARALTLGEQVSFEAQGRGGTAPYSYAWSFGDGTTAGDVPGVTHVYTSNGPFVIRVNVTDAAGETVNASTSVWVGMVVTIIDLGVSFPNGCNNLPEVEHFSSTVTGGSPPFAYNWSFGDGSANSTLANPTHAYAAFGTYNVSLAVHDATGLNGSARISVGVGYSLCAITAVPPWPGGSGYPFYVLGGAILAGIIAGGWGYLLVYAPATGTPDPRRKP